MDNTDTLFFIEINDEIKLLTSKNPEIEEIHKKVYKDCDILWKIENVQDGLMYSIIPSLGESKYSFYPSLDDINLEEFKLRLFDLNESLKLVNRKKKNIGELFTTFDRNRNFSLQYVHTGSELRLPVGQKKESFRVKFDNENSHKVFLLKSVLKEENVHFDDIEKKSSNINVTTFKEKNKTFCNFLDEKHLDEEHERMNINPSSHCSFFLYYNVYFDRVWLSSTKLHEKEKSFFNELKLLCQIKGDREQVKILKEKMDNTEFYNIDHVYSFLDFHCYEYQENSIENQVKNYINRNFELSQDIKHRIRFTVLLNNIKQNFDKKFHNNIKNILPKLLKNLNLDKKRYNDGMYWYGLKMKRLNELKVSVSDYPVVSTEEYNDFVEERRSPLQKNKEHLEKPISTKKLFQQGELENYIEQRTNIMAI